MTRSKDLRIFSWSTSIGFLAGTVALVNHFPLWAVVLTFAAGALVGYFTYEPRRVWSGLKEAHKQTRPLNPFIPLGKELESAWGDRTIISFAVLVFVGFILLALVTVTKFTPDNGSGARWVYALGSEMTPLQVLIGWYILTGLAYCGVMDINKGSDRPFKFAVDAYGLWAFYAKYVPIHLFRSYLPALVRLAWGIVVWFAAILWELVLEIHAEERTIVALWIATTAAIVYFFGSHHLNTVWGAVLGGVSAVVYYRTIGLRIHQQYLQQQIA